jgi:hypothetical protein
MGLAAPARNAVIPTTYRGVDQSEPLRIANLSPGTSDLFGGIYQIAKQMQYALHVRFDSCGSIGRRFGSLKEEFRF